MGENDKGKKMIVINWAPKGEKENFCKSWQRKGSLNVKARHLDGATVGGETGHEPHQHLIYEVGPKTKTLNLIYIFLLRFYFFLSS